MMVWSSHGDDGVEQPRRQFIIDDGVEQPRRQFIYRMLNLKSILII